jgi:hypothetical protein
MCLTESSHKDDYKTYNSISSMKSRPAHEDINGRVRKTFDICLFKEWNN